MQTEVDLRPIDLAFLAAKKRQSPRTGFVHFFYGNESATDTIPLYENVCYALLLLEQKKTEAALEAKDLLLRLLAFQTEEGNFPVYLHDYPRCFGFLLGLKILPLFLLASSSPFLGGECKEKIESSIRRLLSFYEAQRTVRPLPLLWDYRYQMCRAVWQELELPLDPMDSSKLTASDWWEYFVTEQFRKPPTCAFYHAHLQMCIGPFIFERAQEGFKPSLALIDWACAGQLEGLPVQDHPHQIGLAALSHIQVENLQEGRDENLCVGSSYVFLSDPKVGNLALFWKKNHLHRLSLEVKGATITPTAERGEFLVHLPSAFELGREDLFEVAFYVDASPDINLWIQGVKGTSFQLGDLIQIQSDLFPLSLCFRLVEGEGDFCGHIYRSNRPEQRLATLGESFDWKIGLRTLRRTEHCTLLIQLAFPGMD